MKPDKEFLKRVRKALDNPGQIDILVTGKNGQVVKYELPVEKNEKALLVIQGEKGDDKQTLSLTVEVTPK